MMPEALRRMWRKPRVGISLLVMAWLMAACGGQSNAPLAPAVSPTPPSDTPNAVPTTTSVPLNALKVDPVTGEAGDTFTVSGGGFPAGKTVDLVWVTAQGNYVTEVVPSDVKFYERKFTEKRLALGQATADAQGNVTATFTVPEDYGELHDIYARVDDQDIAKGGFRILRTVTFSPESGPVGTPINITVKGMGIKTYESTMAVSYDQAYTGFVTAVTTPNPGTVTFQIRAAGEVGPHLVEVIGAATAVPYLNNWQSPTMYIPWEFRLIFTITEDRGAPPLTVDWPEASRVVKVSSGITTTGMTGVTPAAGVQVGVEPSEGPILSSATLQATGLPQNTEINLVWVTAYGNDLSGWDITGSDLSQATTSGDGSLKANFQIPEGLGGWHGIQLVKDDQVLAEIPYYIKRSLVDVTPRQVKFGETFTVQIKGIGWTQIDNGLAVTYDNAYIGFACGFGTGGDITLRLVATGGPGTHLIDLYPMIYQGARGLQGTAKPPWLYQLPHLTALTDSPGLKLAYQLPIFRLAIEVVP